MRDVNMSWKKTIGVTVLFSVIVVVGFFGVMALHLTSAPSGCQVNCPPSGASFDDGFAVKSDAEKALVKHGAENSWRDLP